MPLPYLNDDKALQDIIDRYPGVSVPDIARELRRGHELNQARQRNRDWEPEPVHHVIQGTFLRGLYNTADEVRHGWAHERIDRGEGTREDYDRVAQHERLAQIEENRSPGEIVGHTAVDALGLASEAIVTGGALRGLSGLKYVGPALRWAGIGAETPVGAGLASNAARFGARTAIQTAAMPSMYGPEWARRNTEAGRSPLDVAGLPSAFAVGAIQTALLNTASPWVAGKFAPGQGLRPALTRVGLGAVVGPVEQTLADLTTTSLGLTTGYGPIGDILAGKPDALKHAAMSALSFALFAGIHEGTHGGPAARRIMGDFHTLEQKLEQQGLTRKEIGQRLQEAYNPGQLNAQGPEPGIDQMSGEAPQLPPQGQSPVQPTPAAPAGQPSVPGAAPQPFQPRKPLGERVWDHVQTGVSVKNALALEMVPPQSMAGKAIKLEINRRQAEAKIEADRQAEVNAPREQAIREIAEFAGATKEQAQNESVETLERFARGKLGDAPFEAMLNPQHVAKVAEALGPDHEKVAKVAPEIAKEIAAEVKESQDAARSATTPGAGGPIERPAEARVEPPAAPTSLGAPGGAAPQAGQQTPAGIPPEGHGVGGTAAAGSGAVVPEPVSQARQMFLDHANGADISTADIDKAAGLTERQSKDFWDYVGGRTLDDIGQDRGVSRNAPFEAKKAAVEKMGVTEEDIQHYRRQELLRRVEAGHYVNASNIDPEELPELLKAAGEQSRVVDAQEKLLDKLIGRYQEAIHNDLPTEAIERGLDAIQQAVSKRTPLPKEEIARISRETGVKAEPAFAAEQRTGEPEPVPAFRQRGGTFGGGPLERVGSNRTTALEQQEVQESRRSEGLNEIEKQAKQGDEEVWGKARQLNIANPGAADAIAADAISGKALTAVERAQVLHRRISVRNEIEQKQAEMERVWKEEQEPDRKIRRMKAELSELQAKRDLADQAAHFSGSEAGRALRMSQLLAKFDYTLDGLLRRFKAADPKRPVTEQEQQQLKDLSKKHQDALTALEGLQKRFDELQAKGGEEAAKADVSTDGAGRDEFVQTNTNVQRVKAEVESVIGKRTWEGMSPAERTMDWIRRARVAFLISGIHTPLKIATSSVVRTFEPALDNLVGAAIRFVPGVNIAAEKSRLHGGAFDPALERDALRVGLKNAPQAIRDIWNTGKSNLDVQFGPSRAEAPRTFLDVFGDSHSMIKSPAVEVAFERSYRTLESAARAKDEDVSSPAAYFRLGQQAYAEAMRAKFQQENPLSKQFTAAAERLKKTEGWAWAGHLMDLTMPIRTMPTNMAFEAVERLLGVPIGAVRTAIHKGDMTPAQADSIMRQFKKGMIGPALLALGYYAGDTMLGGMSTGRRQDWDLQAGEVDTGIGKIPSWATQHQPLLMALHFGATIKREEGKFVGGDEVGKLAAAGKAAGALLNEIPFVHEQTGRFDVGQIARSYALPMFLQDVAKVTDTDTGSIFGTPERRSPHGVVENLEMGIPGLRKRVPFATR